MESAAALFPNDPRQQLMKIGWGYVRFALENRDHLHVMFSDLSSEMTAMEIDLERTNSFEILLDAIQACQSAGKIVDVDPS